LARDTIVGFVWIAPRPARPPVNGTTDVPAVDSVGTLS
jgi:hypothetical protein